MSLRLAVMISVATTSGVAQAQSLREYVRFAVEQRAAVRSAKLAVLSAKQSAFAAGAYPLTRLEVGSGTRPDVAGGEDLTLFQPIDLFGKSRAARRSANASITIAESNLRQARLEAQSDVMVAVASVRFAQSGLDNASELLALAEAVEHATAVRVDAQALPEIQLLRAKLETERARQSLNDHVSTADISHVRLRQAASGNSAFPRTWDDIPLQADVRRTELPILRAQIEQATADGRIARLAMSPDLEVQVRRSLWSDPVERYGIRLQLVIPLWDHHASDSKRASATSLRQSLEESYSDVTSRVKGDLEAADNAYKAARRSVESYRKVVATARDLVERYKRGYQQGAATLTDVYEARRTLAESLDALATAQQSLDLALDACLKARGQLIGDTK